MAGGLFPEKPFAFNAKCIVGTAVIAGGYWWLPPKSAWVLILLLWLPYVAMAWYDYLYDCKEKMQPTLFPLGRYVFLPFKPPGYKAEFDEMPPSQKGAMDRLDHVVGWTLLLLCIASVYYTSTL
jgi:hypothetical protein